MRISYFFIATLFLFLHTYTLYSQSILISEVQINPCCGGPVQFDREWIEVQNISLKDTIDLTTYFLRTDLNNTISNPKFADAQIVNWNAVNPGIVPLVKGNNSSTLKTSESKIFPGEFALILDPTWNNNSINLMLIPDSCKIFTVDNYLNIGSNSGSVGINGLLNNAEDLIYLYEGDPSLSSSILVDSLSWKNNNQVGGYSLQRDKYCNFKWYGDAVYSNAGGYYADTLKASILAMITPGSPNYKKSNLYVIGPDTLCYGDSAHFAIPNSENCGPFILKWNFGDKASGPKNYASQKPNVSHVFSDSGSYEITVVLHMGELKDTAYKTVYINKPLSIDLGNDTTICSGSSFILDAGSGNYTYLWNDSSTTQQHTVTNSGIYFVEVTNEASCISVDTIAVNFYQQNQLTIGEDTIMCNLPFSLKLNAGMGYQSYLWNTGFKGPKLNVNKVGNYYVTVTDSNGCSQTDSIQVSKNNIPGIKLGPDAYKCNGVAYEIDPKGTSYSSYLWSSGATDTSLKVNQTGAYSVTVVDSNGCTSSDTIKIKKNPIAEVSLGNDTLVCNGDSLELNAGSKFVSYVWSTSQTDSLIYIFSAGNYSVLVTDKNGCSSLDTIIINNSSIAAVNLGNDKEICQGDSVELKAGSVYSSYLWSSGQTTKKIYATNAATYSVVVTDANGCQSTDSVQVIINPIPLVSFFFSNVCEGDTVCFSNQSGGGNFLWDLGDQTYSVDSFPCHVYDTAGTYTVTLLAMDHNACMDSLSQSITIYALPDVSFEASITEGCPLLTVDFFNSSSNALSYLWDFGDGITSILEQPGHAYSQEGYYDVTLTATSPDGCSLSQNFPQYIQVYPVPEAAFEFSPAETDMLSSVITFTDLSLNADQWQWNFGDEYTSIEQSPEHMYRDTGSFSVFQIISNTFGCKDTAYQNIYIEPVFTFYVPSTFTPNGDGKNDEFFPKGIKIDSEAFSMEIYNKWGSLIYKTNDIISGWNGKIQGQLTPQDVYVWYMNFKETSGKERHYRGSVTLLR